VNVKIENSFPLLDRNGNYGNVIRSKWLEIIFDYLLGIAHYGAVKSMYLRPCTLVIIMIPWICLDSHEIPVHHVHDHNDYLLLKEFKL